MKTFKKLTPKEKILLSEKTELSYNLDFLSYLTKFILTQLDDPKVISAITNILESFIEEIYSIISKHLSTHENDNETNTPLGSN